MGNIWQTLCVNHHKLTFIGLILILIALLVAGIFVYPGDQPVQAPSDSLIRNSSLSPVQSAQADSYQSKRAAMVANQLKSRDIVNPKVLEIMGTVPRHRFVGLLFRRDAYKDHPLPIGEGQTISQPYVVAFMTQALQLTGQEKVLEIGTGSAYQAAVLSHAAKKVYTVEIRPKLAESATEKLKELGYGNVVVKSADGYFGWKEVGPFDKIMVTAAVNHVPPPLLKQLKTGGQLILPLGSTDYFQTLTLITKVEEGPPKVERLMGVRFVPLVGEGTGK